MRRATQAIFRRTVARPWLMLGAGAILTAGAAASWHRIPVSTDLSDVIGDSSEAATALADLSRRFDGFNPLIVLLEGADAEADVAAQGRDLAIAIEREAARHGYALSVEGGRGAEPERWVEETLLPAAPWYLDEDGLEEILQRAAPERLRAEMESAANLLASPAPAAEAMARRKLADPLGLGELLECAFGETLVTAPDVSADGRTARLRITRAGEQPGWPAVIDLVREAAEQSLPKSVSFSLTGAPAIAAASERGTRRDLVRGSVVASLAVGVIIVLAYRRVGAVLLVAIPTAMSIAWAFGLYAWTGLALTPLTAAGVAILAGLSADYSIHAASAIRARGSGGAGAVADAVAHVSAPMLCACVTTMIGCAALSGSDLKVLHALAVLGALGLASALIVSLAVTPALSGVAGVAGASRAAAQTGQAPRGGALAAMVVVCGAAVVAGVGAVRSGGVVPFETSTSVLHPQPNEPLAAERRMDEAFPESGTTIPVLIEAQSVDGLAARARKVSAAIESALPVRAIGLHTFVAPGRAARAQQDFWSRADADAAARDLRAAAAAAGFAPRAVEEGAALLRRVLEPSEPPGLADLLAAGAPIDLLIAEGSGPALTVVLVRTPEALEDRDAQGRVIGGLREALKPLGGVRVGGFAAVGLDVERMIRRDLFRLTGVAAIGVAVWLGVFFRAVRPILLVFVPVACGATILLGVMHLFGLRFDMISIAAVPLLIGIGVDDGVFLVARSAAGGRSGALHAITTTSATTAVAFGSLVTCSMPALQTLGVTAAVGILGAWIGAAFILHPLLERGRAEGDEP